MPRKTDIPSKIPPAKAAGAGRKPSTAGKTPAAGKSSAGNKEIALQFLRLVEAGKIDEAYRKYIHPAGRHHNGYTPAGFASLQKGMEASNAQFPEMHLTVKNVVAEGELVAVHSHVVLKPGEAGYGTLHLFRIKDGKITEMWDLGQPVPVPSPNMDGMF